MDHKKPEVSLKRRYRRLVELGFMTALLILILISVTFSKFRPKRIKFTPPKIGFLIDQVELTLQIEVPPPPARPSIPVESENDDLLENVTIDPTTLEMFTEIEPPSMQLDPPDFFPYDEAPEPIGGYDAIKNRVKYPEIAIEAGIEGKVTVRALIDDKGVVRETKIIIGIPKTGLDTAAMDAVRRTKFKPGMQRDKPVYVWISIPIIFKLTDH